MFNVKCFSQFLSQFSSLSAVILFYLFILFSVCLFFKVLFVSITYQALKAVPELNSTFLECFHFLKYQRLLLKIA